MSVADLRARCADVPGIHNLSMGLNAGRIELKWGEGYSASADATAPDTDLEAAIRNAAKLPPVTLIPDKPITPAPQVGQAGASSVSGAPAATANPADAMAALDRSMSAHVQRMQDLIDGSVRAIEAKQGRQLETVQRHLGAFGDQLDAQTDAFEAIMSRYSNGAPT